MIPTLVLCSSLAAPPVEQAPPPRPVADDAVTRYIKRLRAEGKRLTAAPRPLIDPETMRQIHFSVIAEMRKHYLADVEFYAKIQQGQVWPEMAKWCQDGIEKAWRQLEKLDWEEKVIRDGPTVIDSPPPPTP